MDKTFWIIVLSGIIALTGLFWISHKAFHELPSIDLLYPIDGQTDVSMNPLFLWKADPKYNYYTFELHIMDGFESLDFNVKGHSFNILQNLKPNTEYKWYVAYGNLKSKEWKFKTRKPYLAVAGGREGIFIYDLSKPRTPNLISVVKLDAFVKKIESVGNIIVAQVCNKAYPGICVGIDVIDVKNPLKPKVIGRYRKEHCGSFHSFAIDEGNIFLLNAMGIEILTISNGAVKFQRHVDVVNNKNESPYKLTVGSGRLYVYTRQKSIWVYDSHDCHYIGKTKVETKVNSMRVHNGLLYVASDSGISIWKPTKDGIDKISQVKTPDLAMDIKFRGKYVYVANFNNALTVIELSDITQPKIVSVDPAGYWSWAVDFIGDYAYVADDRSGLLIFDLSNPKKPILVNIINKGDWASDIAIDRNYVYVADWWGGVKVLERNTNKIEKVVKKIPFFAVGAITVCDKKVLIGDRYQLYMMDVSNPLKLSKPINIFKSNKPINDISCFGTKAFVSMGDAGILILDMSANHVEVIKHPEIPSNSVNVFRNRMYVVSTDAKEFSVFDVSDLKKPKLLEQYKPGGNIEEVTVTDDNIYLSLYGRTIILNKELKEVGNINCRFTCRIAADAQYIYAVEYGRLRIFDRKNIAGLKLVSDILFPYSARKVALSDKLLIIAAEKDGVIAVDVSNPYKPVITSDIDWLYLYDADIF